MKKLKHILMTLISVTIISLVFSSCFVDFTDVFDIEPTTQETTQPKPLEPTETGYGYDSLNESELKELYRLIQENAKNRIPSEEIEVAQTLSEYQIRMVLDSYMYDHPEVFWLDTKYSYSIDNDGATNVYLFYTMESEELVTAKESFNTQLNAIVSKAPENATAYELEMYAHDYLVNNCDYDKEAVDEVKNNAYSAYGAIVENKAVCSGYSKAFQLLCNKLGIECVSITGESHNEGHQWNCVKLDGNWYQVDVTWDDNENGEICQYDYFNLTDETMYRDHITWKLYSEVEDSYVEGNTYNAFIPKCTSDKYNYYKYSCVTITDLYNSDEIVEYIAKSAQDGKKYANFLIDESLEYSDVIDTLINDGYMYDWVEKANRKNDYSPEINPECNVYKKDQYNVLTLELSYIGEG